MIRSRRREIESVGRLTWRRFRHSKLAAGALLYVGVMSMIAFFAPLIANR